MPSIPSANYDFNPNPSPTTSPYYRHPATGRFGAIPLAFQITSPLNNTIALLPHAMVMHVNPANFNETHTKKVEKIQTRGGFVEQHWGDELSEISCDGSTSAFVNLYSGLSSVLRQQTIAWDRYRDLHDLYRNNGDVYDPYGNIVLRGNVMLMYDKGVYIGSFSSFESEETDSSPFTFNLSWNFKVEQIISQLPQLQANNTGQGNMGSMVGAPAPTFQAQNISPSIGGASSATQTSNVPAPSSDPLSPNFSLVDAQGNFPAFQAAVAAAPKPAPTPASSGTTPVLPPNVPAPVVGPVANAPPYSGPPIPVEGPPNAVGQNTSGEFIDSAGNVIR